MANRRYAASAIDARAKVSMSGPFFAPDANLRLGQNIRRMLQGVAEEGERVASERAPRLSGALSVGIEGRVSSVNGKPWLLTAVISATHVYPWKNKGARGFVGRAQAEYRGGKAEGRYRMFRATTYQLRRARAVLTADLTRGLE